MPKKTTKKAAKKAAKKVSEPKITSVKVFNGPDFIRSYDLDVHGDMFMELAEAFAAKKGFSLEK